MFPRLRARAARRAGASPVSAASTLNCIAFRADRRVLQGSGGSPSHAERERSPCAWSSLGP